MLSEAKGFAQTAVTIAADGFRTVDRAPRLAVCETCEFFNGASRRCRKCGCFLDVKAKFRAARCPVGKW